MSVSGKKFDFQGILNNIKSMINLEGTAPNMGNPDDAIGMKISELNAITQRLTKSYEEQVKELTKMNRLLSELFKNIEMLRNPAESKKEFQVESESDKNDEKKK